MPRHPGLRWEDVELRLTKRPAKLRSLALIEETGGEPDVTGMDVVRGEVLFYDCSPETPKGRVSTCYDRAGLESRKEHHPNDTAMDLAEAMGVELLTEQEYRALHGLGQFDRKTSSWLKRPRASATSAEPFTVSAVTAVFSSATMVRSPTRPCGASGLV